MTRSSRRWTALVLLTLITASPLAGAPEKADAAGASWSSLASLWSRVGDAFGLLVGGADRAAATPKSATEEDPAGGAEGTGGEPPVYLGPGSTTTSECTEDCGESELSFKTEPGG